MKPAPAIDFAHRLLHRLGWFVGEAGFGYRTVSLLAGRCHAGWAGDHRYGQFAGDGLVGMLPRWPGLSNGIANCLDGTGL